MNRSVEEIIAQAISEYLDALNAGRPEPLDEFLARYPGLPRTTVEGLKARLGLLTAARIEPPIEERRAVGWQWLQAHLDDELPEGDYDLEAPPATPPVRVGHQEYAFPAARAAAVITWPEGAPVTVGDYLAQTLQSKPEKLRDLAVPSEVVSRMAVDKSPIEILDGSQGERERLAQKYAGQNPGLFSQVCALVLRLRRLRKAEQPNVGALNTGPLNPMYGRDAPQAPHTPLGGAGGSPEPNRTKHAPGDQESTK